MPIFVNAKYTKNLISFGIRIQYPIWIGWTWFVIGQHLVKMYLCEIITFRKIKICACVSLTKVVYNKKLYKNVNHRTKSCQKIPFCIGLWPFLLGLQRPRNCTILLESQEISTLFPKKLFKETHERILLWFSEPNNNCQPDDILPKRTFVFCFLTFFAWPSKAKNPHNTTRITRIGTSFITHTTIVVIGPAN